MDLQLNGRVAIVTGASQGIGRAIAETLAAEGATVIVNHFQRAADARRLCRELGARGLRAEPHEADVGDAAAVQRMIDDALGRFGRVDIAIHNAGITSRAAIVDTPRADWDRVMRVNLDGAYHLATAAARAMIERQTRGALLAVTSLHARVAKAEMGAYCTSKAAITMLFQQLAVELAPYGIRANCIAPGTIDTGMNPVYHATDPDGVRRRERLLDRVPLRALGEPQALARSAAFLVSPLSSYTTGTTVVVDGGYTADGTPR